MWFTYGPPTENPFDRDEEISTLIKLMRGGQPVSLVGPRRIGKTSILLASLKKSNLPYVLISAEDFLKGEKGFNFTEFLSAYVSKVILSLHPFSGYAFKLEEKVKSYLKVLRDLLGAVKISLNIPEVSGLIEVVFTRGVTYPLIPPRAKGSYTVTLVEGNTNTLPSTLLSLPPS